MRTTDDWTVERLLRPIRWDDFLAHHWQREPLHVRRADPAYHRELTSTREVDHLVATHGGSSDFPITVVGGRRGQDGELPKAAPGRAHWTPENVYARLARGATIRIGNMPRYSSPVRRLAAHLETALSTDVNVNLYLTPRGASAFGAHFDNHDVFIAQIDGAKTWKIYAPPEELPIEITYRGRTEWLRKPLPYDVNVMTRPSVREERVVELEAGDLLYVPRGFLHEVWTGERDSLHLTIAAPVVTWYEVAVHALLAASAKSGALREALPAAFATDPVRRANAHARTDEILAALRAALDAGDLDDSVDVLAEQFAYSRRGDWEGLTDDVLRLDELTNDTELRVRPALACAAHRFRDHLCVLFSGRSVDVPIRAESMLRYALENERFRVGDLPTALDDESRLLFARELLARGFLVFAP